MTTLSQYLLAERFDTSEPVDFYIPGAQEWGGSPLNRVLYQRRTARGFDVNDLLMEADEDDE